MARTSGSRTPSPRRREAVSRFTPTSMTTAPSFTMSPVTNAAHPAAAQRMSARRQCPARSARPWRIVTVACRPRRSWASGLPTRRERPRPRPPPLNGDPVVIEDLETARRRARHRRRACPRGGCRGSSGGARRRPWRGPWPCRVRPRPIPRAAGAEAGCRESTHPALMARMVVTGSSVRAPLRVEVVARGDADFLGSSASCCARRPAGRVLFRPGSPRASAGRRSTRPAQRPRLHASTLGRDRLAVEGQHRAGTGSIYFAILRRERPAPPQRTHVRLGLPGRSRLILARNLPQCPKATLSRSGSGGDRDAQALVGQAPAGVGIDAG